jgi:hypothetical protein
MPPLPHFSKTHFNTILRPTSGSFHWSPAPVADDASLVQSAASLEAYLCHSPAHKDLCRCYIEDSPDVALWMADCLRNFWRPVQMVVENVGSGKWHTKTEDTVKESKAIPVTGRGGLQGYEMLRIPHCLDNRLTVNCEILATCSGTYSPVRTSQEAHSVSIK